MSGNKLLAIIESIATLHAHRSTSSLDSTSIRQELIERHGPRALQEQLSSAEHQEPHPEHGFLADGDSGADASATTPWMRCGPATHDQTGLQLPHIACVFDASGDSISLTLNFATRPHDPPANSPNDGALTTAANDAYLFLRNRQPTHHLDPALRLGSDDARALRLTSGNVAAVSYERRNLPPVGQLLHDLTSLNYAREAVHRAQANGVLRLLPPDPIHRPRGAASMTTELGQLRKRPIKEIWASENRDFTPWLAQNLDYLSERIGLDLELVATEVPVGPFRVDLVAQVTGTDDLVVVENQFGPTDHDHLGKLLTYAAGQEAAYAVWIAENFRSEHRSALEWANRNSIEGVGYFGLRVEALQIDSSPIAVQLVGVVEPDQWAKQVTQATATLTNRNQLYMGFWGPLIERIKVTYPGWTNKSVPPKDSWMDLPSGKSYPWYTISFTGDKKVRVELYVDNPEPPAQQHLWQQLVDARAEIDAQLPDLSWEPLDGKRASRIALYSPFDASVDREDEWDTYRTWLLDSLGTFRTVIQPHIDQLTAYDGDAI